MAKSKSRSSKTDAPREAVFGGAWWSGGPHAKVRLDEEVLPLHSLQFEDAVALRRGTEVFYVLQEGNPRGTTRWKEAVLGTDRDALARYARARRKWEQGANSGAAPRPPKIAPQANRNRNLTRLKNRLING